MPKRYFVKAHLHFCVSSILHPQFECVSAILEDNSHAQIYDSIADNMGMASKCAILQGYKESVDSRSRERGMQKSWS